MSGRKSKKSKRLRSRVHKRSPGRIALSISVHKTIRYVVVASTNTWPITREECLNLFFMGTGTNSARRILGSVKINRIVIYAEGAFPTTASTAMVTSPDVKWLAEGPQTKYAMSSFGGQPQYLSSKPPAKSFAGYWSMTGVDETQILCEITAGTGSVIDITYDFVIQNDDPQIASGLVTSSTATAGIIYYNNLGGAVSTIQPLVGNANYAT